MQYLLASQTNVDSKMILRKAGYVGAAYREQYDEKVGDAFPVVREMFTSDMHHVVDYLAEGNSFRSNRLVVHICY